MDIEQSFINRAKAKGSRIVAEEGLLVPDDGQALLRVLDVALSWLALLSIIHFAPLWLSLLICWPLAIRLLNCMAQVTHFCGHLSFFSEPRWNAFTGQLTSMIMGYPASGHDEVHESHHLFLNTAKDGDLLWGKPDQSRSELLRGLLQDLLGLQAFRRLGQYLARGAKAERRPSVGVGSIVLIGLFQLLVFFLFTLAGGIWAYGIFYVFPICSLYPAQARIRSLAEHHYDGAAPSKWAARNTMASFLENQIIGPFNQNYHFEHHLFPRVPGYYLPALHKRLAEDVTFGSDAQNAGYFSFLIRFLRTGSDA